MNLIFRRPIISNTNADNMLCVGVDYVQRNRRQMISPEISNQMCVQIYQQD